MVGKYIGMLLLAILAGTSPVAVDAGGGQNDVERRGVVVITNVSNPLSALSRDQVKGIFTGRITNWKEVGGDDAEVVVVWSRGDREETSLFRRLVLDGEYVTGNAVVTPDFAWVKDTVSINRNAIAINPPVLADAQVKVILMRERPAVPQLPGRQRRRAMLAGNL